MDLINIKDYQNVSWIESLALDEVNMEESGIIRFNEHINTDQILEESSLQFMDRLKDRFEFFTSLFNQYRGNKDSSKLIKIFKVSNTVNDFILFRHSLKLIISRRANDCISIGFLSHSGGLFIPRPSASNEINNQNEQHHEIKAHVGPFNSVSWRYRDELVNIDSLVKYYLSEFIKLSSR